MKKLKFPPMLILIFVLAITMLTLSITYAKYVTNRKNDSVIKPTNFIFNSNYVDKETYNIYTNNFTFNIDATGNSNTIDITYTVTVKNVTNDTIKQTNEYVLDLATETSKTHTINGLEAGNDYEIIISSTNPIKKTITHYVNVLETELESYYSITDHDSYIVVDIYIGNTVTGKVTINYNNSKVLPDNLNILMEKWFTNTGTITVSNNSHYELIFFKTDNTNFNKLKTVISGNNVTINIGL